MTEIVFLRQKSTSIGAPFRICQTSLDYVPKLDEKVVLHDPQGNWMFEGYVLSIENDITLTTPADHIITILLSTISVSGNLP